MTILVIVQSRGSVGIESACLAGDLGLIPGRENTLEKQMATHSSILAQPPDQCLSAAGEVPVSRLISTC